jgi:predicted RNA-binding protein YlqC (UPF0109 family)
MINFKHKISKFFKDKNDFKVKYTIQSYFDGFSVFGLIDSPPVIKDLNTRDMGIHKVTVKTKSDRINITICLDRPGLIIGKKGSTIEALKKHLEGIFNKKIHISIKEFNVWG